MSWLRTYLTSSIGRKQLMGATGVILYGFLAMHLSGNMLLFLGEEVFNKYAHQMTVEMKPLTLPVEFLLLAAFIVHVYSAFHVTIENRRARKSRYHGSSPSRGATIFSATMAATGGILLIFIIAHVPHLRLGVYETIPTVVYGGVEMKNVYFILMKGFSNPLFTAFYIFSLIGIGFHLAHGVKSSLQTFGISHPKYNSFIAVFANLYAFVITLGFIVIAVWSYITIS